MSALTLIAAAALAAPATADRQAEIWSYAQSRMQQQTDVWFDAGDFPKCIQALKMEFEAFPEEEDVATNLGWMQENIQDRAAAKETYTDFMRRNPKNPDAPYPLAQFHFMRDKNFAAIPPLLEPTLARKPHPNSFRVLAHTYDRLKRYEDSIRVWTQYIKLMPEDGAAKVNLARVEKKAAGR